jgi:hypothetical protein
VSSPRRRWWRRIVIAAIVVVAAVALVRAWDASRQLPNGDGWQLLAQQRATGDRNGVQLINDQAALDAAWKTMRLTSETPQVDFGRSIVAWLTPVGTIACTTRLDDISFDRERRLVDGAFSLGLTLGCDSPPVSDSFLVALNRDRLPDAPYRIRILGPDQPPVENGHLDVTD